MFEASRSLTHAALAVLILIWGTTWVVIRVGLRGLPPFTGEALAARLSRCASNSA